MSTSEEKSTSFQSVKVPVDHEPATLVLSPSKSVPFQYQKIGRLAPITPTPSPRPKDPNKNKNEKRRPLRKCQELFREDLQKHVKVYGDRLFHISRQNKHKAISLEKERADIWKYFENAHDHYFFRLF